MFCQRNCSQEIITFTLFFCKQCGSVTIRPSTNHLNMELDSESSSDSNVSQTPVTKLKNIIPKKRG